MELGISFTLLLLAIIIKWVHKIKHTTNEEVEQYKEILISIDYKNKCDINYENVFFAG